jgi:hypothetical protein
LRSPRTLSASNAPASTTWRARQRHDGGYRISRGLPNRSVQLVEELTDLAEALWEAFEHRSDATSFLDQVAGDREQLCDSVTAEWRACVTATQLFESLLDVAHGTNHNEHVFATVRRQLPEFPVDLGNGPVEPTRRTRPFRALRI